MAAKKAINQTIEHKFKELFELCPYPVQSEFEQENFNSSTGSAQARSLIYTVNRIRKINSDLENETKTFEKKCLEQEKFKLEHTLSQQDPQSLVSIINDWEQCEQDYWVNFLGKQAAIELLTFGKPSFETMSKMVKLPEDLYIKSTQICVKLANAIKQATMEAELAIGVANQDEAIPPEAVRPKKLSLKRTK